MIIRNNSHAENILHTEQYASFLDRKVVDDVYDKYHTNYLHLPMPLSLIDTCKAYMPKYRYELTNISDDVDGDDILLTFEVPVKNKIMIITHRIPHLWEEPNMDWEWVTPPPNDEVFNYVVMIFILLSIVFMI